MGKRPAGRAAGTKVRRGEAWRIVLRLVLGAIQLWAAVILLITLLSHAPLGVVLGIAIFGLAAFATSVTLGKSGFWGPAPEHRGRHR